MNGVLLCARYAFAPNFLQYCGPDQNPKLWEYLKAGRTPARAKTKDDGLERLLAEFNTLNSYLQTIAHANGLADPFDPRVVEAYWIGNQLLEKVPASAMHQELVEGQQLKKKLPVKLTKWLFPKVARGAKLHHSFHVFNVFTRTGHHTVQHTVETMDNCRIGWGQVEKVEAERLMVEARPVIYEDGQLKLGRKKKRQLKLAVTKPKFKPGDWVSFHWNWVCDKLTPAQVSELEKYTKLHLKLANQTL